MQLLRTRILIVTMGVLLIGQAAQAGRLCLANVIPTACESSCCEGQESHGPAANQTPAVPDQDGRCCNDKDTPNVAQLVRGQGVAELKGKAALPSQFLAEENLLLGASGFSTVWNDASSTALPASNSFLSLTLRC